MRTTNDTSVAADTITFYYGNGGEQTDRRYARKAQENPYYPNQGPPYLQSIVELISMFGADQRIFETRRLSTQQAGAGLNKHEFYRYDALGRRVWRKAVNGWDMTGNVRDTLCTRPQPSNECMSFVERTIWDGDQVLYEIRSPSGPPPSVDDPENDQVPFTWHYGKVAYTHAGGIDQPLELVRLDGDGPVAAVPHADWRGVYDMVTFTGTLHATCGPSIGVPLGSGECYQIDFESVSAFTEGMFKHSDWTEVGPRSWFGNLLNGQRDASGLQYRRNRYYDPVQGRFTQEDPMGLAGGVNLYGFASGDPVNFSDPFGLCPPEDPDSFADCAPGTSGWYAYRAATGQGSSFLNTAGGLLTSCNESFACQAVLFLASLGSSALEAGGVRGATSIAEAGRLGRAGEAAAGIAQKGKAAIPSLLGTAARRIPDAINWAARTLTEVKNVRALGFTNQIADELVFAKANNLQFILKIDVSTRLSPFLQKLEQLGEIVVERIQMR